MVHAEPTAHEGRPHNALDMTGDATLLAPPSKLPAEPLATAQTVVAPSRSAGSIAPLKSGARTSVLPRIEGDGATVRLVAESKNRYEPVRLLGAGGMGEVMLVNDQDIARQVAVKRLLPELDDPAVLARFVDEIRTVGRLEHPNIVPIHDVGVDENGRYFFVMKYVEGETLESIIKKLAAGDAEYQRRYTVEHRIEIFISILNALSYAHANGVVHRDVKPANVMVGDFGEVMLMDWGIAKPISSARDLAAGANGTIGEGRGGPRDRMYATRVGSLVGTPAYMSPEQARGNNHAVNARSDLYSAAALFYEFLSLHHYLEGQPTAEDLLAAIIREDVTFERLLEIHDAQQVRLPRELLGFIADALAKDPTQRPPSASEMVTNLQNIIEGRLQIRCHVTMTKRMLRESARLVDRRPRLVVGVLGGMVAAVLFTVVEIVRLLVT